MDLIHMQRKANAINYEITEEQQYRNSIQNQ
jgi:hypothetical protein